MRTSPGPFIVIHPEGDRKRLRVLDVHQLAVEFYDSLLMATKNLFDESKDANSFAADLAEQNYIAPGHVTFA
jgi:hypothetical protein